MTNLRPRDRQYKKRWRQRRMRRRPNRSRKLNLCKWGPKVFRMEYYPEVIFQNY